MRKGRWVLLGLVFGFLVGCTPGGVGREGELIYLAPLELLLSPGEILPGTQIQYLEKREDGARVLIGGQEAMRKVGDSLNWQAELLDGVAVSWSTRVGPFSQDQMRVLGTVEITVRDPAPTAGEPDTSSVLHFTAPVTYNTKRERTIPSTTLTYLGSTEQGAELGNLDGYPYRKLADSIVWQGRLKDRLHIRLNLRVILYTDNMLQVAGTSSLWLGP